jgi:hypothetical protein
MRLTVVLRFSALHSKDRATQSSYLTQEVAILLLLQLTVLLALIHIMILANRPQVSNQLCISCLIWDMVPLNSKASCKMTQFAWVTMHLTLALRISHSSSSTLKLISKNLTESLVLVHLSRQMVQALWDIFMSKARFKTLSWVSK